MNKILFLIIIIAFVSPAFGQTNLGQENDKPVEITADGTLEWKRNDKIFVAKDNAVAEQGDVSISAALLTANYRENEGSGMEIWKVTASDNVVIRSKENDAYGEKAVYDLDKGFAVMNGNNLRMVSPDQIVTARDSFEYWVADGRLVALGAAKVKRKNTKGGYDILEANKITAILKENDEGERVLHNLEAIGNVIITTTNETITGTYGIYRADTNKAELTGSVTIRRGPNILEGEKAEVDLNTNTSRMFGDQKNGGRVRGVFYPGSEEKPEEKEE